MEQKTKPNYNRPNAPALTTKINIEDRIYFRTQTNKDKQYHDERLYNDLLKQFDQNPIINNVQSTVHSKFNK
jgi:hypothetical protein